MSLDITFTHRKKYICPKYGEIVGQHDSHCVSSGGRAWYPILESIGYYVPYEQRTEENDWYGKDMILSEEQAKKIYRYAQEEEVYNWHEVVGLIAMALCEKDDIVVNADW